MGTSRRRVKTSACASKEGVQLSLFAIEVSPFKLNMYRECPRRYKFHYIDGLSRIYRKPRPYLILGESVHATLFSFFSLPPSHRSPEKLELLFWEHWKKKRWLFPSREEEERWQSRALAQVKLFARGQDLRAAPFILEEFHQVPLTSDVILRGKIDRADWEEGGLHVIDYKTGAEPGDNDRRQLWLYVLILEKEGFKVKRASIFHLETGKIFTSLPDERALEETERWALETAESIREDREFAPQPGRHCASCDFLPICFSGQGALISK